MEPRVRATSEKELHVIEDSDGWGVLEGEETDTSRRYDTKAQALEDAKKLAVERGVEVVVHGADGSVLEREFFVR